MWTQSQAQRGAPARIFLHVAVLLLNPVFAPNADLEPRRHFKEKCEALPVVGVLLGRGESKPEEV